LPSWLQKEVITRKPSVSKEAGIAQAMPASFSRREVIDEIQSSSSREARLTFNNNSVNCQHSIEVA
jgi:hypothetical protein